MSFRIYKWSGEEPYRNKNQRDKRVGFGEIKSLYPWKEMQDGDSFFVPCDPKNQKDIHSKINVLRTSAKNFGYWIKCYKGAWSIINGQYAIKVIMDGKVK